MTRTPRLSIQCCAIALFSAGALTSPALGQDATASAAEVAEVTALPDAPFTIRRSSAEEASFHRDPDSGDIAMMGSTLASLLAQGFTIHPKDIDAGDIDLQARFDVLLRPGDDGELDPLKMVHLGVPRALGLSIERQEREGPVYRLGPAKDTPQLEASTSKQKKIDLQGSRLKVERIDIAELIAFLRWRSPYPVLDESGLTETYDFVLEWDESSGTGAVFHALNDIGLEVFPDQGSYTVLQVRPAK